MSYAIYRNKSDNNISKIHKNPVKYSPGDLEILINNYNNDEGQTKTVEIIENGIIGEILDYLERTEQLQNNWKFDIKKELLEQIERAQSELNDLEMFVHNFKEPSND